MLLIPDLFDTVWSGNSSSLLVTCWNSTNNLLLRSDLLCCVRARPRRNATVHNIDVVLICLVVLLSFFVSANENCRIRTAVHKFSQWKFSVKRLLAFSIENEPLAFVRGRWRIAGEATTSRILAPPPRLAPTFHIRFNAGAQMINR